jgi:hypothetical protein
MLVPHTQQLPSTRSNIPTRSKLPRVVFLGIYPTYGLLLATLITVTLFGNYFGALANWVKLQSIAVPQDKLSFSVVSWQALWLKLPQDPRLLSEAWTTVMALIFVKRPLFFIGKR